MGTAFSVGDKAVYPVHGVTEVVALENREISGFPLSVYILHVLDTGTKIMVPTSKADAVGLREIVPADEIPDVYAILRSDGVVHNDQTWNRRQREYTEKMKTGSIFEIAEVFRDLRLLGRAKQLSFSERRMVDTAKHLLAQELAIAQHSSQADVVRELDEIFAVAA